ncbi:hypothetical protein [Cupriavidus necator]
MSAAAALLSLPPLVGDGQRVTCFERLANGVDDLVHLGLNGIERLDRKE